MTDGTPRRVSIVAIPDALVSPASGLFETLKLVGSVEGEPRDAPADDAGPFEVEIVGEAVGAVSGASGLSLTATRALEEVDDTDIVIVSSMAMHGEGDWLPGRYPRVVAWIREMHARGATIGSACTGAMLTAETGILDGQEATVHWMSEASFRRRYPDVHLRMDDALVVSGEGGRLVTSGTSTAWHDLALYLIAREVGPQTAQAVARMQLLDWHREGQRAFHVFHPSTDHGDAAVLAAQRWIADNYAVGSPVEEMVRRSGLAERTFKRRFKSATGHTPIDYAQRTRVERAKRLLETSGEPVEEISWRVGYEDPASFRRLFKRVTSLTPAEYRQRFRIPELPNVAGA